MARDGDRDTAGSQTLPKFASRSDFLAKQLEKHIEEYKGKRNLSRLAVKVVKIATIVIGGATTILLGLKGTAWLQEGSLTASALVLSATNTMLTAWEAFADNSWKWVRYRTTLVNLYNIRDDLRFKLADGGQLSEGEATEFFQQLKTVLSETNDEWMSKRVYSISGPSPAEEEKPKE
jgi:Protein of unknown function (DUF4231)